MARTTGRSPRSLWKLSLSDLQKELVRRRRHVTTLERRRSKLLKRVATLDAQIAANGGSNGTMRSRGGRTRPHNSMSLIDALAKTLRGKTMSVSDAAGAVQRGGYRTSSPNFRTMVNAALLNKKMFKRVERGKYTAV